MSRYRREMRWAWGRGRRSGAGFKPPLQRQRPRTAIGRAAVAGSSFQGAFSNPQEVPRDGGVYLPALGVHWNALALVTPSSWHLMQSSGSPVPDVAAVRDLTATASPDYLQAGPAGWAGKFINLSEDAAVESLIYNSTTVYNPASDDVLDLCIANFTASGANTRQFMRLGTGGVTVGSGGQLTRPRTDGTIQLVHNGVTVGGVLDHRGQVRPYLLPYDRSNVMGLGAGYLGHYTNIEKLDAPADLTATNAAQKGIGGTGAALCPAVQLRLHAKWYGAAARAMFAIGMKTILQRLGWTVTGY